MRWRLTKNSTSAADAGLDMVSHAIGPRCVPGLTRTGTGGRRSRDRQTTDARLRVLTRVKGRESLSDIRMPNQVRATG